MRAALALLLLAGCKDGGAGGDTGPDPSGELCNGLDDDGDGAVDEGLAGELRYRDGDGDGYGDPDTTSESCASLPGYLPQAGDCDDTNADIFPGASELCGGLDEDCDGAVDEGAQGSAEWSPDQDGDGWGDSAATPTLSCERPEGMAPLGDCDDLNALVNPDAAELCDGVDNDCSADTPERGTVSFADADADGLEDWTERFVDGTAALPEVRILSRPGRLRFCEGTWYTSLRARADLEIEGVGGREAVVLSGADQHGVLIVRDPVTVRLSGLTLTDGEGSGAVLGELSAGGGVECDAAATVSLNEVTVRDSHAGVGGGVFARGCSLTLTDSALLSNQADHYGGGLAMLDGAAALVGAELSDNSANYGAGLSIVGDQAAASVSLEDSLVQSNQAARFGGGAMVEGGSLSCTGQTSLSAGLLNNSAVSGGGVYLSPGGALSSVLCDWGGRSDNNVPDDVSSDALDFGLDETFTCDPEGCTP